MQFWKLLKPKLSTPPLVNPPRPQTMRPTDSSVVDVSGQVLGKCLRSVYYRMTGEKEEAKSDSLEWAAFMGKAVENAVADLMQSAGIECQRAVKFHLEKERIAGEVDWIIRDPETGELMGLELKTFSGYPSKKKLLGGKDRAGKYTAPSPKDEHFLQTLVYLWAFRGKVALWKICYFSRDESRPTEFDVWLQEEGGKTRAVVNGEVLYSFFVEDILRRYTQLAAALDQKILPAREFVLKYTPEEAERLYAIGNGKVTKTSIEDMRKGKGAPGDVQCRQCSFTSTCWGGAVTDDLIEDEDFT